MSDLSVELEGETVIVIKRYFAAPPQAVFRAHTEPHLIQQWMLGPEGWTMLVCVNEAKPGGKFRYEWVDGKGGEFHLTGEFIEVDAPHRIVHVERMHMPDPTPDNRVETTFVAEGEGTRVQVRMNLPDAATRKAMLASGMEHGMEASYVRLDALSDL